MALSRLQLDPNVKPTFYIMDRVRFKVTVRFGSRVRVRFGLRVGVRFGLRLGSGLELGWV